MKFRGGACGGATDRGAKPENVPRPLEGKAGLKLLFDDGGGRAGRDGCDEGVALDGRPGGGGYDMMNGWSSRMYVSLEWLDVPRAFCIADGVYKARACVQGFAASR